METASNSSRKRPVVVTILTWILVIGSLLNLAIGIISLAALGYELQGGEITIMAGDEGTELFTDQGELFVEGVWYTLVGLVQLVITIGFWRTKRWGWVAVMTLQALNLLMDVANALAGNPGVISLGISILLVLLLNQSDVRRTFGILRNPNEPAAVTPLNSLDSH